MTPEHLSAELRAVLEGELDAGEKVTWLGQRHPKILAKERKSALRTAAFATVICASFLIAYFILDRAGALLILGAVVSGIVVRCSLAGAKRKRLLPQQEAYAVTDRRVLIVRRKDSERHVFSILANSLVQFHRRDNDDGSGTIRFGPSAEEWSGPGFEDIADVREVEKLLRALATQNPT